MRGSQRLHKLGDEGGDALRLRHEEHRHSGAQLARDEAQRLQLARGKRAEAEEELWHAPRMVDLLLKELTQSRSGPPRRGAALVDEDKVGVVRLQSARRCCCVERLG